MKIATRQIGQGSRQAALVHGIATSGTSWLEVAQILADRYDYTVTMVDLRGHGESPNMKSYLIREFAQDLKDTLPKGLDLLMGHALGGRIAAESAAFLQPHTLICLDPGIRMKEIYKRKFIKGLPSFIRNHFKLTPPCTSSTMTELVRASLSQWDSSMTGTLLSEGVRLDFRALAPTMPATVLLADNSLAVSKEKEYDLKLVGWSVRHKPGSVHEMHWQDPEGTVAAISDLLGNTQNLNSQNITRR